MAKKVYSLLIFMLLLVLVLSACSRVEVEGPEYELRLSTEPVGAGRVTQSSDSTSNKVTLEAIPDEGFEFKAWLEDGAEVSSEPLYKFAHTEDRRLTALFVEAAVNGIEVKANVNYVYICPRGNSE